jgi:hypothetical protein
VEVKGHHPASMSVGHIWGKGWKWTMFMVHGVMTFFFEIGMHLYQHK